MRKRASLPPIPPLSIGVLAKVQAVEEYARHELYACSDPVSMSFNTEQASRLLRTCVVTVLDLQIEYYASLRNYYPEWIRELATKAIDSALGLFRLFVSGESLRGELQRTVKHHLAEKAVLSKVALTTNPARINRKKMRDSYLVRFPEIKKLDICWAARQHYSEWKRWLRDAVKDGSAPDRAFRAILTSGKVPREYRKQPRPRGWK
jgi:hypothetical protein